jgi:hypothetical protein
MAPKTLRQALDAIEEMLTDKPYSEDLWTIITALRGPDSRNKKLKYATTAVIRQAAFPNKPSALLSVYSADSKKLAQRRVEMFAERADFNHFREHIAAAFTALKMDIGGVNGIQADTYRSD